MTQRQKKQYQRGVMDAFRGVIHAAGRGRFYDYGYSDAYTAQQGF